VVVGTVAVWPVRCYGHLIYDRGGARRPIGEWHRPTMIVLQCDVIYYYVVGVIDPYMLQRGGEQALVAWRLGDTDGVTWWRRPMRLSFRE
jgi:hypothetical protein